LKSFSFLCIQVGINSGNKGGIKLNVQLLRINDDKTNRIVVSKNLYQTFRFNNQQSMYVRFGDKKEHCSIKIDPTLKKDTILLPENMLSDICIPPMNPYECMFKKDDTLLIGPVIGIMGCRKRRNISEKLRIYLKSRLKNYLEIKGLVFIFAEEDVDRVKKVINGFFYNSKIQNWEAGVFPLPGAVIVGKISMSSKMYRFFINEIGENVFYHKHLSKWYQWKVISTHSTLSKHLPYTEKLNSGEDLLEMINRFNLVYLKPNKSYQGRGIVTIEKKERHYMIKNTSGYSVTVEDGDDLLKHVKTELNEKYLIQEAVGFRHNDHLIDFRVYLQKNRNKEWESPGIMARIGKKGSIITNFKHRIDFVPSHNVFAKYYGLNNNRIQKLQTEMIMICKRIAELMEMSGNHLGDLAFDMSVDKELTIWMLEFQGGYGSELREKNMPIRMYKQMMLTPLEYAKTLAGF
jgi:hypothetical protein